MDARSRPLTSDERAVLSLVGHEPGSGDHLLKRSGLEPERFALSTERLWQEQFLQGVPGEGCCQDPCGMNCISASEPDRTWTLTEFGKEKLAGVAS